MSLLPRLKLIAGAGSALAALAWYAWRVEPRWLRITRLTLPLPNLPPTFEGYRIVHLSDLHLSARVISRHLPIVVQAVRREQADLIAITGDFVTSHRHALTAEQIAALAGLRAPDGVWAIPGNHDMAAGIEEIERGLRAAGIRLLRNEHHIVRREGDRLILAGIDDVARGQPDLPATLAGVSPGDPVILMAHEPDFARIAAVDPRVALQLSGHTHGGQIRLPGLPLMLPAFGQMYPAGEYQVGDMWLYVTRGIGVGLIVLRFNCRPEIAVLTLTRSRLRTTNGRGPAL